MHDDPFFALLLKQGGFGAEQVDRFALERAGGFGFLHDHGKLALGPLALFQDLILAAQKP
jgi:hypothetical protein